MAGWRDEKVEKKRSEEKRSIYARYDSLMTFHDTSVSGRKSEAWKKKKAVRIDKSYEKRWSAM